MTAAADPMPDLHTALEAAITARLEVARAAKVDGDGTWHLGSPAGWLIEDDAAEPVVHDEGSPIEEQAAHIALHDPDDAVRRYERDLRVLARHAEVPNSWGSCSHCRTSSTNRYDEVLLADWPCDEITDLLDVYPEVRNEL